jgi:hypothetical protein
MTTTTSTSVVDPDFGPGGNTRLDYKVRAKDISNHTSNYSSVVTMLHGAPWKRGVSSVAETPQEYSLHQNYPNPFNPSTEINYSIQEPSFVTLSVFNTLGQEITQLVGEYKEAGNYSVRWQASNLPSGMYFYKITAGLFNDTKKMILAK